MNRSFFINAGLFLVFSLTLFFTTTAALVGLAFSAIGIYIFFKERPTFHFVGNFPRESSVLLSLFCMALVLIVLNIYHQERWGTYHLPNAILLLLPAFIALAHIKSSPKVLWAGGALGALIACSIATFEIVWLNAERAGYWTHNPIPFGSISMCLAAASIIGYQSEQKMWRWVNLLALSGLLAGVVAAVLTGSKGCLLALPVLAYLVHIKVIQPMMIPRAWQLLSSLLVLTFIAYFAKDSFLAARTIEAINGALNWFTNGQVVEGSVGPRLELIRFAFEAGMINPITGIGRDGMLSMLLASGSNGAYDPLIAQLHTIHNEFLNIWVTKGVLGLLAMIAVYGLSLWFFWRIRKDTNIDIRNIGLMGISLCLMYLIFGLTEVALQLTFFRNFFLVLLISLVGMTYYHRNSKRQ